MPASRPRRTLAAGAFFLIAVLAVGTPAHAQSGLGDLVNQAAGKDTTGVAGPKIAPPAPWPVVTGQVVSGTLLSAALGYAVGALAESFCDGCDAAEPGGDTPGMAVGVPVGAIAGSWLIGKLSPPGGRFADTALGALAGTAVFAGYSQILEEQSEGLRWAGIIFPAALATMGWNRSRPFPEPQAMLRPAATSAGGLTAELTLLRVTFP